MRGLANIVFLSDHNANVEQGLALIAHSLFYMGITSGPASLPILSSDIPYVATIFETPDPYYNHWLKPGDALPWQNKEIQHLIWDSETGELLIEKFEDLYGKVDKEKWRNQMRPDEIDERSLYWPYFRD